MTRSRSACSGAEFSTWEDVFPLAPLLIIEDLRMEIKLRRATVHAIDGVSMTVDPGECLGIVGESGSGKTMTALSIMRLLPSGGAVVGGRIVVDGTDVAALPEIGRSANGSPGPNVPPKRVLDDCEPVSVPPPVTVGNNAERAAWIPARACR